MQWLSLAEYWYNTNFHSFTHITPFEAVYGQPPPTYVPYESGDSLVEYVDRSLQAREHTIQQLKFYLQRAQDRMRNLVNKHGTDRQFEVGVWVYVKLQPHRQVTLRKNTYNKLSSKYYGPFQAAKKVGQVAYQLALPATSQIHNVFHVSQLKKCTHPVKASGVLPAIDSEGLLLKTPASILDRRLGKVRNSPVMYVLMQWTGESVEDATWEIYGAMSPVRKSCLSEKDDHDTKCFESILLFHNDMVSENINNKNRCNSGWTTSNDEADLMDEDNEGSSSKPGKKSLNNEI
ncbi:retrotransposable element Tf2 [Tanacetum coccineum]